MRRHQGGEEEEEEHSIGSFRFCSFILEPCDHLFHKNKRKKRKRERMISKIIKQQKKNVDSCEENFFINFFF